MRKIKSCLFFLVLLVGFSSCSFEKRIYRSGFYIDCIREKPIEKNSTISLTQKIPVHFPKIIPVKSIPNYPSVKTFGLNNVEQLFSFPSKPKERNKNPNRVDSFKLKNPISFARKKSRRNNSSEADPRFSLIIGLGFLLIGFLLLLLPEGAGLIPYLFLFSGIPILIYALVQWIIDRRKSKGEF